MLDKRSGSRLANLWDDAKAATIHGGEEFGTDGAGDAGNGNYGIVAHFGLHSRGWLKAIKKPRSFSGGALRFS